jgi:hypothetical protein
MTPHRFRQITEAYGALPEHWPEDERAAAKALLAQRDPQALAALDDALQLDDYLEAFTVTAPDTHLIRRIIGSAPAAKTPRRTARSWRTPNLWFSGAGLIGVGAAGIAAGFLAVSMMASVSAPGGGDQIEGSTVFSSNAPDWSDQ